MSSLSEVTITAIREDFPILSQNVNGHPLIYVDNAATTQKPWCVINAVRDYYVQDNANVHRGIHTLSMRATDQYEAARQTVADYIGAASAKECVFVRGTTEGINLVAEAYLAERLKTGDEIVITQMEHHSNIVPWQRLCERYGAKLVVAPISQQGEIILDAFEACLNTRTVFVAFTAVSNALGTVNPIKKMVNMAHAVGAKVLIDGAQAMPHLSIDVRAWDADFFVFSGHKVFAPTGIGVLWGRAACLEEMSVYQSGGEMIRRVTFEHTDYAAIPTKFEAGTPDISGAIGLAAALRYLKSLDWAAVMAYEAELLSYATTALRALKSYQVVGEAAEKVPVLSFLHPQIHAHDIGTILDQQGIAIRSGHHCAMPIMAFYGVAALGRFSFAFYNTKAEVDRCMEALMQAERMFL